MDASPTPVPLAADLPAVANIRAPALFARDSATGGAEPEEAFTRVRPGSQPTAA